MNALLSLEALLLPASFAFCAEPSSSPSPQPSTPEAAKAVELVRELGDSSFYVRETAAKQLRKLGRHAKPALVEGAKSADSEVWNRCVQLLPEVMALDLKARVEAYIADTEGKQKHDLPMLERFRKIAGNDAAARKLFVDMLKENAEFLESCESNPKLAAERYNERATELYQQTISGFNGRVVARNQINVADLSALFLVGAVADPGKNDAKNFNPVANLLYQQPFQNALRAGEQAVPLRKLLFAWAESRDDVNTISVALQVVQNNSLKEGLDFAVKVMKMKDLQVWTRAQAMTCVGKIGGKEHLPAFEALFEDKTLITNMPWQNVTLKTQVNDVALAMAVQLSGQKHKDYGFDALAAQPALLWQFHFVGFSTDEKRDAAFKKYKELKAAEKKKYRLEW